jgi:hypothetical protein
MTASIDYRSFTDAIKRLDAAPKQLQKELVDNLHKATPGIQSDMRGHGSTKIQRAAVSTVHITRDAEGITIRGGGGGGLGGQLFAGGEFGGRKSTKRPYATRSPNGKAYVVRRRVTMQFLPHLGNEGYFYWPTIRDWLPKLFKQQQKTLDKVMGGGR